MSCEYICWESADSYLVMNWSELWKQIFQLVEIVSTPNYSNIWVISMKTFIDLILCFLQRMGFAVLTNLNLETRPCKREPPVYYGKYQDLLEVQKIADIIYALRVSLFILSFCLTHKCAHKHCGYVKSYMVVWIVLFFLILFYGFFNIFYFFFSL